MCPVLARWRPSQVLSFSPHTSFSLSVPQKQPKTETPKRLLSKQHLLINPTDQAQQLCHITIWHIALLDGQRPQNFNLLQHKAWVKLVFTICSWTRISSQLWTGKRHQRPYTSSLIILAPTIDKTSCHNLFVSWGEYQFFG